LTNIKFTAAPKYIIIEKKTKSIYKNQRKTSMENGVMMRKVTKRIFRKLVCRTINNKKKTVRRKEKKVEKTTDQLLYKISIKNR